MCSFFRSTHTPRSTPNSIELAGLLFLERDSDIQFNLIPTLLDLCKCVQLSPQKFELNCILSNIKCYNLYQLVSWQTVKRKVNKLSSTLEIGFEYLTWNFIPIHGNVNLQRNSSSKERLHQNCNKCKSFWSSVKRFIISISSQFLTTLSNSSFHPVYSCYNTNYTLLTFLWRDHSWN